MNYTDFQNKTLADTISDIISQDGWDFTSSVPTSLGREHFVHGCLQSINDEFGDFSDIAKSYLATSEDVDAILLDIVNSSTDFIYNE